MASCLSPPVPWTVSIPEQQVSNRFGLLTKAVTVLGSLPHTRPRSPAGAGLPTAVSDPLVTARPAPPCRLSACQGVHWEAASEEQERERHGTRDPASGAPPCRQICGFQGGRVPTGFVGETGGLSPRVLGGNRRRAEQLRAHSSGETDGSQARAGTRQPKG